MKGPTARSSVNDRFCATTSATSSGHRKALRAARRNARERMPLLRSAFLASSSAISVFDGTFENRFRLELQGGFPNNRRLAAQSGCTQFFAECDFSNDG